MYRGIAVNDGIKIADEDAYSYAIEMLQRDDELKAEFLEWFFSGNWIKEEQ